MSHIHWYPGHIAKAEKQLKEKLSLVDVVIEVLLTDVFLVEIENVCCTLVAFHQRFDERMNLHLDVGFIGTAILGFGSFVHKCAFLQLRCQIHIHRIHAHQAEREDEAVTSHLDSASWNCIVMVNLQNILQR